MPKDKSHVNKTLKNVGVYPHHAGLNFVFTQQH